jgi:CubicO group peptidase (beta-lactamase class C family)
MSTDVLGAVVEAVSGTPLDDFIAAHITAPLGMHDTGFRLADGAAARLAEPHLDPATGAHPLRYLYEAARPPRWIAGGSGLLTTATDYARFAQMLLNGGELDGVRILARKTVALMLSDHLPPGVRYGSFTAALGITAPLPEYGQGFGLGMVVRTAPGRNPSPGSVGDFTWPGISGCYWWADPQEELVAVLMLQAPAVRVRYRALLRDLVYQALA